MELVLGSVGELPPGPYVDCPEEGCAYTLSKGNLVRHRRDAGLTLDGEGVAVDPELLAPEHERPRLRRIARMLRETAAAARLSSPFVVFVPREGDTAGAGILPGSGIVGAPLPGAERVVVHFEGARSGQVGMARLADRVRHAHGRLAAAYPTVARMVLRRASLVEVATFDPAAVTITPIDRASEAALAAWLGTDDLDPAELVAGGAPPDVGLYRPDGTRRSRVGGHRNSLTPDGLVQEELTTIRIDDERHALIWIHDAERTVSVLVDRPLEGTDTVRVVGRLDPSEDRATLVPLVEDYRRDQAAARCRCTRPRALEPDDLLPAGAGRGRGG